MKRFIDKFLSILGICIIFLSLFIFFIGIYLINTFEKREDCFKEIAIKECNERGLILDSVYSGISGIKFSCKIDEREVDSKEFIFLKEEIEKCSSAFSPEVPYETTTNDTDEITANDTDFWIIDEDDFVYHV